MRAPRPARAECESDRHFLAERRRALRAVFCAALAGGLALLAFVLPRPALAGTVLPSAYDGPVRITYHRGQVQHHPVTYLVLWGPQWRQGDPSLDVVARAEASMFVELSQPHNSWMAQLRPYGVDSERFGGIWRDPSATPRRRQLRYRGLTAEVVRAAAHFRVRHLADAQFVVLPEPDTNLRWFASTGECGEHDYLTAGGYGYVTALIAPLAAPGFAGCTYAYGADDGAVPSPTLASATTSLTSHEFAEAATDPNAYGAPGWMNPNGGEIAEIADECYFYSGVPAGMRFNLSYLWNRGLHGCTLQ